MNQYIFGRRREDARDYDRGALGDALSPRYAPDAGNSHMRAGS